MSFFIPTYKSQPDRLIMNNVPFVGGYDVEQETKSNNDYRRVRVTLAHMQYVEMSLSPKQEIGWETHAADQFFKVEKGSVYVMVRVRSNSTWVVQSWRIKSGQGAFVPGGFMHNVVNASKSTDAKLYTIYSPPQHAPQTRQHRKPLRDE